MSTSSTVSEASKEIREIQKMFANSLNLNTPQQPLQVVVEPESDPPAEDDGAKSNSLNFRKPKRKRKNNGKSPTRKRMKLRGPDPKVYFIPIQDDLEADETLIFGGKKSRKSLFKKKRTRKRKKIKKKTKRRKRKSRKRRKTKRRRRR